MTYKLVRTQFPYRQAFLRPRRRTTEYDWFRDELDLSIDLVEESAAPVAYEVRFGTDSYTEFCGYKIRTYQGKFWWPLGGDFNYVLHPETFASRLGDCMQDTLVALDPTFTECIERRPLHPFPAQFNPVEIVIPNHNADRRAAAQRGAFRTIFCGDGVYVEAGEPIFYAVPTEDDPKLLILHIGVSDMRRESAGTSYSEPGPTKLDRKKCAQRGLAFGIAELEDAIPALEARSYRFKRAYRIDVLVEQHQPETAAFICARELAEFLLVESARGDAHAAHLRAGIPILGSVSDELEAEKRCVEILDQLRSSANPVLAFDFIQARRNAEAILRRIDDVALASLGMGWVRYAPQGLLR